MDLDSQTVGEGERIELVWVSAHCRPTFMSRAAPPEVETPTAQTRPEARSPKPEARSPKPGARERERT